MQIYCFCQYVPTSEENSPVISYRLSGGNTQILLVRGEGCLIEEVKMFLVSCKSKVKEGRGRGKESLLCAPALEAWRRGLDICRKPVKCWKAWSRNQVAFQSSCKNTDIHSPQSPAPVSATLRICIYQIVPSLSRTGCRYLWKANDWPSREGVPVVVSGRQLIGPEEKVSLSLLLEGRWLAQ